MGMLPVGSAQDLTLIRPGGAHQPFIVHAGDHVLHLSVAIFIPHPRIIRLKARRQNDRPYIYLYLLRRLIQINGVILAYCFANTTFLLFQVKTAFINVSDQGNGLSEIDMDGFILRYFLIEWIRVLDRAVFYTGRATPAFVLQNIPGLLSQGDPKVSCFSFYTVNFSIRQDFYIGVPADLDQFGGEYSYRAVIGGKGLVKLGHVAANGRRLVHQINLKARSGKIKRGLNTADPSTDNHYVCKITVSETLAHLFSDYFFVHFLNLIF
jgi:hypothetical protein